MRPEPDITPERLRAMPDEQFLRHCRWDAFRGPGPGGQKRNKTSSAVRVTHEPTGLSAVATESRSQAANQRNALRRLRLRIALELRQPVDVAQFAPPPWWRALCPNGALDLSPKSEQYLPAVGLVMDVLTAVNGAVSDAARLLGLSTAQLVSFLEQDEKLWAAANALRAAAGLKPLR